EPQPKGNALLLIYRQGRALPWANKAPRPRAASDAADFSETLLRACRRKLRGFRVSGLAGDRLLCRPAVGVEDRSRPYQINDHGRVFPISRIDQPERH